MAAFQRLRADTNTRRFLYAHHDRDQDQAGPGSRIRIRPGSGSAHEPVEGVEGRGQWNWRQQGLERLAWSQARTYLSSACATLEEMVYAAEANDPPPVMCVCRAVIQSRMNTHWPTWSSTSKGSSSRTSGATCLRACLSMSENVFPHVLHLLTRTVSIVSDLWAHKGHNAQFRNTHVRSLAVSQPQMPCTPTI
jgi:hypothetical protein